MSRLDIFRDDTFVAEQALMSTTVSLGRHPDNDIVLDDRTLSRFHARVERRGDRFVVVDLGAANGVFLNGVRIVGESGLTAGDRIGVGRYVAIFDQRNAPNKRSRRGRGEGRLEPMAIGAKGEISATGTVPNADVALDIDFDDDDEEEAAATTTVNKPEGPIFVLLYNGLEVSRYALRSGMIIGRSKNSDVVISLLGLSRRHAEISVDDDGTFRIEDLGSQNGTWVNQEQVVGQRRLDHGDILNFYEYSLLFLENPDDLVPEGADFSGPGSAEHDLEVKETGRRGAPTWSARSGRSGAGPVPALDSDLAPEISMKLAEEPSDELDLDSFGAGSFFEEASEGIDLDEGGNEETVDNRSGRKKAKKKAAARRARSGKAKKPVLKPETDKPSTQVTSHLDRSYTPSDVGIDSDLREELEAFDDVSDPALGFESDKTAYSYRQEGPVAEGRGAWPSEDAFADLLRRRHSERSVILDVSLDGKPYTQMTLTLPVTRIGTDPLCELSLPQTAGLSSWQLTLVNFGGRLLCVRANADARVLVEDVAIDQAVLKAGDVIALGRVRIAIRER